MYQGHYGPWSIEPEDVAEVWSYRIGLSATVAGGHGGDVETLQQEAASRWRQQCSSGKRPHQQHVPCALAGVPRRQSSVEVYVVAVTARKLPAPVW